ncbi:MAG: class I SAM-dependent methyltransferase [Gammaproteobacteria bacterium]|nr:class I SAM-dependent methyltransferase [Gammaproteobacteria bacterium]
MNTRKTHWEKVYQTKDHKKVGWYQESPEISLKLLSKINATSEQSVIDIGCGASYLVDNLLEKEFKKITLVDISSHVLKMVRQRLGSKGDIPTYLAEDITQLSVTETFDIWHDRAVFHFLTEPMDREKYMSILGNVLSANGRAIIGTFSLNGPNSCSGLDVVQYNEEKMTNELPGSLELESTVTDIHIMPGGSEQEYKYFIIKNKNT